MSAPTAQAPAAARSTWRGAAVPLATGAAVAATTLALRLRDPHQSGSWGLCPTRAFTGLDCPFCGGLRAVNDLTHGDLGAAAASNLLFVVSIPLILGLWVLWLRRAALTARDAAPPPPLLAGRTAMRLVTAYAVVAVLFTIWRNTPWGHGLWA